MGRPKKSKETKVLQGTFRKHRDTELDDLITAPPVRAERPHRTWNKWARGFYVQHFDRLVAAGLLGDGDVQAFELLCQTWGNIQELIWAIGHNEETGKQRSIGQYHVDRGLKRTNMPELQALKEQQQIFTTLSRDFGLTPASRSRVETPKKQEVDPLAEMFAEANAL